MRCNYEKELKEIIIKQSYIRYYGYEDNIYDLTAERVEQCQGYKINRLKLAKI